MINRPKTEEELQKREAIGVIRASRFVRKFAHSHQEINLQTIFKIHAEIFNNVWPEIAGKYREENLKITNSKHLPPHFSEVKSLMEIKGHELKDKLLELKMAEGIILDFKVDSEILFKTFNMIVRLAAWIHHFITFIHPFREGNGRTARLAANLILERYGLIGISIKIEKENKNRYRQALAQIDSNGDFEPLVNLIYEGLLERYNGVALKFYNVKGK